MCSFAWTLQAIYRSIAQLEEFLSDTQVVTGSIPVASTKCSFNNRGLEQVISVKTNPIGFIARLLRNLNHIKESVVVGFGPVHKGDRM